MRIAPGICYGRLDVALAEAPDAMVAKLGDLSATIWSSPSRRCLAVAALLGPHHVDARLLELDFGLWEGVPWDDVPRDALDAWASNVTLFSPPGGESGSALVTRVRAFHSDLAPGNHVVVSHGGPLKVLAALLRGQPVDLMAETQPIGSVILIE